MTRPKAKRADKPQETQSWDQPSYEAGIEAAADRMEQILGDLPADYRPQPQEMRALVEHVRTLRRPPPTENRARKRKK